MKIEEDPLNTQHAQQKEVVVVFTRENRGGSALNTQHAQHRPVQATDRCEPSPTRRRGSYACGGGGAQRRRIVRMCAMRTCVRMAVACAHARPVVVFYFFSTAFERLEFQESLVRLISNAS